MKKIILTILIALTALIISQKVYSDDYTDAMKKTLKKLDAVQDISDRGALLKIRGDFERILQLKKNEWMINYYMAYCDLMIAWSHMGEKPDNESIKKHNESSIDLLNKSTDLKDDFAEAYILKMSANSNRWQYEPNKMNDIIAKGSEASDMAKKLEPENPRYFLVDATITYYTPENFGGGVDKAMPLFEKSWELFQSYQPKDETYPSWGKDQAAGMIALCYVKKDKFDEAKKWIDKGLELVPESGFLKGYVMKQYEEASKK
jgi:tetratricopeptide (TPR) repeat protein